MKAGLDLVLTYLTSQASMEIIKDDSPTFKAKGPLLTKFKFTPARKHKSAELAKEPVEGIKNSSSGSVLNHTNYKLFLFNQMRVCS